MYVHYPLHTRAWPIPARATHIRSVGRTQNTSIRERAARGAAHTHHPHTPLQSRVSQRFARSSLSTRQGKRAYGEPHAAHATRSSRATPPTRHTSFRRLSTFPIPSTASSLSPRDMSSLQGSGPPRHRAHTHARSAIFTASPQSRLSAVEAQRQTPARTPPAHHRVGTPPRHYQTCPRMLH